MKRLLSSTILIFLTAYSYAQTKSLKISNAPLNFPILQRPDNSSQKTFDGYNQSNIKIISGSTFNETNNLPVEIRRAIELNKAMIQKRGGATSGGGDDIGLEVSRAIHFILQMVSQDQGVVYSTESKKHLLSLEKLIRILVIDAELPATVDGITQNGFAYSFNDGENVLILIQSNRWKEAQNPADVERTLHHELAVLTGLEKTGDYNVTDKFTQARVAFWQKVLSQNFACTFSLFSKSQTADGSQSIEKFLGAAGVVKKMDGQGGFVTLARTGNKLSNEYYPSVIVRYVISANGYLRAAISEADVLEIGSDWRTFQNLRNNSKEKVYFTPYDLIEPQGSNLESWGPYFVQISCSKI
ncbi:MAG TPA: hypothetical protein VN132_10240 [Bdellovibrio sp.]|nr:hypothetical protein [Bdellovibrio sp.]